MEHFRKYYNPSRYIRMDLTTSKLSVRDFVDLAKNNKLIGFINYDLIFRRPELLKLKDITLLLDESSLIQNENAKRTKFIMSLNCKNVILLSGTPVSGKYENLWSQCRLLGWNIPKTKFYENYIRTRLIEVNGFRLPIVIGYRNIRNLKENLEQYGAIFLKSDEVLDLPNQVEIRQYCNPTEEYVYFKADSIITVDGEQLVGDNTLKKILYERQLCGHFNSNKIEVLKDLMESTSDRLIIFYNFNREKELIVDLCKKMKRDYSLVNGECKDLKAYEEKEDAITIIQYQAGSMGLNLQKANKIIYFTLPLSSDLFEQSKKRIHRIGQNSTCFYYYLLTKYSIEVDIYSTLLKRQNYTNELYRKDK